MQGRSGCLVCVVAVLLWGLVAGARGQATGGIGAGQPGPVAGFEVASVRPVAEKDRGYTSVGPYGLPRFTMKSAQLSFLIGFAYDVPAERFVGAPKGLEDAVFDVDVKSEGDVPLTYERLKPLMQELLAERFGMVAHRARREDQGYALVVAKGGPKLTKAEKEGGTAYIMRDQVRGTGLSMGGFAGILTAALRQPVEDETGVGGIYDIALRFEPQDGSGDDDAGLPSLFTALKEQLGLKLKPKVVRVDTLVIEHVNKTATPD